MPNPDAKKFTNLQDGAKLREKNGGKKLNKARV